MKNPCFKSQYVPFGTQKQRFLSIGYHPKTETQAGTYHFPEISPDTYQKEKPRINPCSVGYNWGGQLKLEEEFVRDENQKAKWMKTVNGPGWHEVDDIGFIPGGTIGKAARFDKKLKRNHIVTPGPGLYGKDHIPAQRLEEKKAVGFCTLPTFEWNNVPRSTECSRSYHLPPNIYKIKGSIQQLADRVVSLRGPYQLFTGPRDNTSLIGFQSAGLPAGTDRFYNKASNLDLLNHPKNYFKGEFFKTSRDTFPPLRHMYADISLAKKDPDDPAPNFYDLKFQRHFEQNIHPFNQSVLHARPIFKIGLKPGPGRYYPESTSHTLGDGWRSNFLSKSKRGPSIPPTMGWFG